MWLIRLIPPDIEAARADLVDRGWRLSASSRFGAQGWPLGSRRADYHHRQQLCVERAWADGYTVTAPQFPLNSLADKVARLREVLAHSYPAPAVVTL